MKKLTIYSKFCVPCLYGTEYLNRVKIWADGNGYSMHLKRTAYNPLWQAEAKKYRQEYEAFILLEDTSETYDFATFLDDVLGSGVKKDKRKTKPVKKTKRKANNDLCRLSKTEEPTGVDSVLVETEEAKEGTRERTEE